MVAVVHETDARIGPFHLHVRDDHVDASRPKNFHGINAVVSADDDEVLEHGGEHTTNLMVVVNDEDSFHIYRKIFFISNDSI